MKDMVFGLLAIIGWLMLMTAVVCAFFVGITTVGKAAMLIGGGMFTASVIYSQREEEGNGFNR